MPTYFEEDESTWAEVDLPRPSNIIGSIAFAWGKEAQRLLGCPTMICRRDLDVSHTEMWLTSTNGLPAAGSLNFDGIIIPYINREIARVRWNLPNPIRPRVIPRGAIGKLETSLIRPDRYNPDPNDVPETISEEGGGGGGGIGP